MNSSPLFLHYVFVPMLPAFEPNTGESTWAVFHRNSRFPPHFTPHVFLYPSRLPAFPQDLPVYAAGLHIWSIVSALFPGPDTCHVCPSVCPPSGSAFWLQPGRWKYSLTNIPPLCPPCMLLTVLPSLYPKSHCRPRTPATLHQPRASSSPQRRCHGEGDPEAGDCTGVGASSHIVN